MECPRRGALLTATGYAVMVFGQPESFGIEIGAADSYPEFKDFYVQFRFRVGSVPMGDWDDRISLSASTHCASLFCDMEPGRRGAPFAPVSPAQLFQQVYDAYFSHGCFIGRSGSPDLRAVHHLDPIGMGAIRDRYGLILVASADGLERVLAKDLQQERFIADVSLPMGSVEAVLAQYIDWGRSRLQLAKG
jgi:hypothetical protein